MQVLSSNRPGSYSLEQLAAESKTASFDQITMHKLKMRWIRQQHIAGGTVGTFTFFGEKLFGVLSCQDQLAWNFTKELDNQRYVIYRRVRWKKHYLKSSLMRGNVIIVTYCA